MSTTIEPTYAEGWPARTSQDRGRNRGGPPPRVLGLAAGFGDDQEVYDLSRAPLFAPSVRDLDAAAVELGARWAARERGMNQTDSQDLAQETVLVAWMAAERFVPGRARSRTLAIARWAHAIARNIARGWARRARHPATPVLVGELETLDCRVTSEDLTLHLLDGTAVVQEPRVRKAAKDLPPSLREALDLALAGFTVQEQVGLLGISRNAVRSRQDRMRAQLRESLGVVPPAGRGTAGAAAQAGGSSAWPRSPRPPGAEDACAGRRP